MKMLFAACLLYLAASLHSAHALSITLASQTDLKIHVPENVFIDVSITGLRSGGLNALLGGFEMDLRFDPTLFNFLPIAPSGWGPSLGQVGQGEALGNITVLAPGVLHVSLVSLLESDALSCVFCTGPYLTELQADSFRLATFGFYAYNASFPHNTTTISIDNIILADALGNALPGVQIPNPSLVFQVPVPATLTLLLLGLACLAATLGARGWPRVQLTSSSA